MNTPYHGFFYLFGNICHIPVSICPTFLKYKGTRNRRGLDKNTIGTRIVESGLRGVDRLVVIIETIVLKA